MSLWQQAGFYVPTQSPPPVWFLNASLGLCREGLLGGPGVTVLGGGYFCRGSRNQCPVAVDFRRD